jgi:hypothetical protein
MPIPSVDPSTLNRNRRQIVNYKTQKTKKKLASSKNKTHKLRINVKKEGYTLNNRVGRTTCAAAAGNPSSNSAEEPATFASCNVAPEESVACNTAKEPEAAAITCEYLTKNGTPYNENQTSAVREKKNPPLTMEHHNKALAYH